MKNKQFKYINVIGEKTNKKREWIEDYYYSKRRKEEELKRLVDYYLEKKKRLDS